MNYLKLNLDFYFKLSLNPYFRLSLDPYFKLSLSLNLLSIEKADYINTLLIFKAYLYIVKSNILNFIVVKWAAALKKAIEEVKKLKAKY